MYDKGTTLASIEIPSHASRERRLRVVAYPADDHGPAVVAARFGLRLGRPGAQAATAAEAVRLLIEGLAEDEPELAEAIRENDEVQALLGA